MKLIRVLSDLKCTRDYVLNFESDNEQTLYWYVDAACYVHADMKIHIGSIFYLRKVIVVADSTNQKLMQEVRPSQS